MTKVCDHTSVGILVWKNDELLLIERKKGVLGFAVPAGHVDEFGSYENAAKSELKEEVGLDATELELLTEGRKNNHCRRVEGIWHYWKLYKATVDSKTEIQRSESETKQAGWYNLEQIKQLAEKTEKYNKGEILEEEWEKNPGLEPVMYEWLKELEII